MDFKKYLIVLVFLVIGVFVGMNLNSGDSAGNTALTLFSKPTPEVLMKNQAIKLTSSSIRNMPIVNASEILVEGKYVAMDETMQARLDAFEASMFQGISIPSGANERPIACRRIEGSGGPYSFSGNYSGSASGTFNSLMIGDGWQSLYRCRFLDGL